MLIKVKVTYSSHRVRFQLVELTNASADTHRQGGKNGDRLGGAHLRNVRVMLTFSATLNRADRA